jgi:hypothetical protein
MSITCVGFPESEPMLVYGFIRKQSGCAVWRVGQVARLGEMGRGTDEPGRGLRLQRQEEEAGEYGDKGAEGKLPGHIVLSSCLLAAPTSAWGRYISKTLSQAWIKQILIP